MSNLAGLMAADGWVEEAQVRGGGIKLSGLDAALYQSHNQLCMGLGSSLIQEQMHDASHCPSCLLQELYAHALKVCASIHRHADAMLIALNLINLLR
jgi:hypothetical protein